MSEQFQRDAFFKKVYEFAYVDKDVFVVVADMSASALDDFRKHLPSQFINVGIAEQNAIQIASGLALAGKKVFVYAISSFLTLRALEQIRVSNGIMEIPITIVGMGTGLSYETDGPTHHLIEDISIMRAIPNIRIISIADSNISSKVAEFAYRSNSTIYVRLDKNKYDTIYDADIDVEMGMKAVYNQECSDYAILTTGPIVHNAIHASDRIANSHGLRLKVIDVFSIPINIEKLLEEVKGAKKIFTIEEHFLPGGFGGAVCECLMDSGVMIPTKRIGISPSGGYKSCYKYGGRDIIRKHFGIDDDSIVKSILENID